MPKKFLYDMKELGDLFQEQLKIKFPEAKDLSAKDRTQTPQERITLFLDILNRYGEDGWELITVIMAEINQRYYIFKKESYAKKATT